MIANNDETQRLSLSAQDYANSAQMAYSVGKNIVNSSLEKYRCLLKEENKVTHYKSSKKRRKIRTCAITREETSKMLQNYTILQTILEEVERHSNKATQEARCAHYVALYSVCTSAIERQILVKESRARVVEACILAWDTISRMQQNAI